jgi:hypothetical protein
MWISIFLVLEQILFRKAPEFLYLTFGYFSIIALDKTNGTNFGTDIDYLTPIEYNHSKRWCL